MACCLSERWGKELPYFSRSDASNSRLLSQRTPLEQGNPLPAEPHHALRGMVIHLPVARSKEGIHFLLCGKSLCRVMVTRNCHHPPSLPPSPISRLPSLPSFPLPPPLIPLRSALRTYIHQWILCSIRHARWHGPVCIDERYPALQVPDILYDIELSGYCCHCC